MFANMCSERDRHPEFDGYRSISATLVDLLRGVGCAAGEGGSTPVGPERECGPVPGSMFSHLRARHHSGSETPSLVSSTGSEAHSSVASPSRDCGIETLRSDIEIGEMAQLGVGTAVSEDIRLPGKQEHEHEVEVEVEVQQTDPRPH